jgi:hypothetical protein
MDCIALLCIALLQKGGDETRGAEREKASMRVLLDLVLVLG